MSYLPLEKSASKKEYLYPKMTDEQLEMALKNEVPFDDRKHTELNDEQYRQLKRM